MTRPATGTDFASGGFGDIDNRFNENRTGSIAVLARDARGADTNISPHNEDGSVHWNPLSEDGNLRDDLLAWKKEDGLWSLNPDANEGFHILGSFPEGNGIGFKSSYATDEDMVEQQVAAFDSTITKDDELFSFTVKETARPVVRHLLNNLPLSDENGDSLVDLPGGDDAGWGKPASSDPIDRQLLFVTCRVRAGRPFYRVVGVGCAQLSNKGSYKVGKKGDAPELEFRAINDGYMMAMVPTIVGAKRVPVVKYEWVGGKGWTDLAPLTTPAPLTAKAATGTAGSAATATTKAP